MCCVGEFVTTAKPRGSHQLKRAANFGLRRPFLYGPVFYRFLSGEKLGTNLFNA
jgi:hypothetical protein